MIAEPYICIKGFTHSAGRNDVGDIVWFEDNYAHPNPENWRPYADFEREKLILLLAKMEHIGVSGRDGFFLQADEEYHASRLVTGFNGIDYADASESTRLLKRAEFLKAVCEKEGVEWLPRACDCQFCKDGNHHRCGACALPSSKLCECVGDFDIRLLC